MISTLQARDDKMGDGLTAGAKRRNLLADYAAETKKIVEEAQSLVSKKNVEAAVEKVMAMEKKARLAGDFKSVEKCCVVILRIFQKQKDYENLNKYVTLLCKRRSQSETVQTAIISLGARTLVPAISDNKEKERFIQTLREISAGKLMVEVIRAELTMTLAKMKETEGNVAEACKLIQEETPETYTSMERRNKFAYILEQIRLCLATKDYIRAKILSKKIDRSSLDQFEDLKIIFHNLLIDYNSHERESLELAQSYLALSRCETIKKDPKALNDTFRSAVLMLACAPHSNTQVDLIHNLLLNEAFQVKELEDYKDFITHFVRDEVAQWPLPEHVTIASHPLMVPGETKVQAKGKGKNNIALDSLSMDDDDVWIFKSLFDSVIYHDLRVISQYYSKMFLDNLAGMLNLDVLKAEEYIGNMVSNRKLTVKIDRADGIIVFDKLGTADETLTQWTDDIGELLNLVDKTCHLIHKETMLQEAQNQA